MTPACRTCGGRVPAAAAFCLKCIDETSKLVGAVAHVACRFDIGAPVTDEDLDTIERALAETVHKRCGKRKLSVRARLAVRKVTQVVELEVFDAFQRLIYGSCIIVRL